MSPLDIAYTRLCIAVFRAGVTLWQDRMEQWVAGFDVQPRAD